MAQRQFHSPRNLPKYGIGVASGETGLPLHVCTYHTIQVPDQMFGYIMVKVKLEYLQFNSSGHTYLYSTKLPTKRTFIISTHSNYNVGYPDKKNVTA